MTLFILAYAAGLLTIASPCIFPILPFVLARADQPFRRGGLPLLIGLVLAFAAVATLAAVAGGWAVEANRYGRTVALGLMTLFGLAMIFPALAERLTAPIVAVGSRLSNWAGQQASNRNATTASSIVLGIATGMLWAPCAGPVLGLILTGAALHGPGIETSLLLLTYGAGAATSLAAGLLFGRRLAAFARRAWRWDDGLRRVLGAAVIAGAATIWLGADTGILTRLSTAGTTALEQSLIDTLERGKVSNMAQSADHTVLSPVASAPLPAPLSALFQNRQWLSAELSPNDVRGKVVLVSFWTYSCINCLRTLPYVRAWAEKYKDRGLVVVGVHTPEFAFEKDAANVRKAAASLGVGYPVVTDNNFAIWRAFDNNSWPALYFIGADGRVRHHTLGEGGYEHSERWIEQLLSEQNGAPVAPQPTGIRADGAQAATDIANLRSGETYVGYHQATNFTSAGGIRRDVPNNYSAGSPTRLNTWSLAGDWTVGGEFATLNQASGSITYRFHARDLHLVLGSDQGRPIRFRVKIDGAAPGADHGSDVDAEGWGAVHEHRLYQLVRQSGAVSDRTFEIEFVDPGVHAYAFTFG